MIDLLLRFHTTPSPKWVTLPMQTYAVDRILLLYGGGNDSQGPPCFFTCIITRFYLLISFARGVSIQLCWLAHARKAEWNRPPHSKEVESMVDRPSLEQLTGLALGNYHLQQMLEDTSWGPIYMATATDRKNYIVRFL